MTQKRTKQGVRDLNNLPGYSKGKQYIAPPVHVNCRHRWQYDTPMPGWITCKDCGDSVDTWKSV